MIAPADAFGPWAPGLDRVERIARLKAMRAIARLCLGPRGRAFAEALRHAEAKPDQLEAALQQLNALVPLDRRSVLASFAGLHRSAA